MQAATCVDKVKEIRIEIEAYATAGWQVVEPLTSFNQDSDSGILTVNVLAKLVNAALQTLGPTAGHATYAGNHSYPNTVIYLGVPS